MAMSRLADGGILLPGSCGTAVRWGRAVAGGYTGATVHRTDNPVALTTVLDRCMPFTIPDRRFGWFTEADWQCGGVLQCAGRYASVP